MRITSLLMLVSLFTGTLMAQRQRREPPKIAEWTGKTIMVFGAHPDDETSSAGTMALLKKHGNRVILVTYTNGNKGSQDPEMTSDRLAKIRLGESVAGLKHLGIPREDYINLGYDDGELEYVDRRELTARLCRLIRTYRPDALFTHEIGKGYMRWQKTDHRSAGTMTADGARAAMFHLYNNDQILYEGLKPFIVPHYFFWSSIDNNYFVDISETWEQKGQMRAAHISQSGSNWQRYTGSVSDEEHQRSVERTKSRVLMRDGKPHEVFRHYSGAPDGAGS